MNKNPTDDVAKFENITSNPRFSEVLQENESHYRQIIQALPAAIYTCNAEGYIMLYNKAAVDLWGREPEIGKDLWCGSWRIFRPDGSAMNLDECPMARALKTGKPVYGEEIIVERPDGGRRNILPHPRPLFNSAGKVEGAVNMLVDITEHKKTQQALRESEALSKANAELERSNTELEQFAYVASHDLQEPLRKIQMFSNLLQETSKEALSDKAGLYLNKIVESAHRMTGLIDDLLNFSRLGRIAEPFVKTPLNEIFKRVEKDFEVLISQKNALITQEPLPEVEAIPVQMNQLFHNLIGNALKFSRNGIGPVIQISCKKLTRNEVERYPRLNASVDHYEIIIGDNGIGFNQQYADQIFIIFQRLHGRSEFGGSGIGLALCRKIVNNHGGEIFAMGSEDEGAEFHVILPEKHSAG